MRFANRPAFSLVEVTLALGVAGIALLALLGLLPLGQQIGRNAAEETAAPKLLTAVAADLRLTAGTMAASPLFGIEIPANSDAGVTTIFLTGDGEPSTGITPTSRYRLTVLFSPNAAGIAGATFASLKLSWPAAADPAKAAGSAESFVGFLRNQPP